MSRDEKGRWLVHLALARLQVRDFSSGIFLTRLCAGSSDVPVLVAVERWRDGAINCSKVHCRGALVRLDRTYQTSAAMPISATLERERLESKKDLEDACRHQPTRHSTRGREHPYWAERAKEAAF